MVSRIRASTFGAGLWLVLLAADGGAAAQAGGILSDGSLNTAQLVRQAQALGTGDSEVRKAASIALSHFSPAGLPAAREHFNSLLGARPSRDEALRVLIALRHAAGSTRADDETDLAKGLLPLLAQERSSTALVMAQSLLFLRGIEALQDPEADLELARFVGLDEGAWDNELRLVRKRRGVSLLPALIQLRSHENANVRRFAQANVTALGMDDPQLALSQGDAHALSNLVRAYASPPDYAAMPVVVRLVNDRHIEVRAAARWAVERYGKNAIWQVRALYEEISGQPASKGWSFERSSSELYGVLDRAHLEDASTLMARGMKSYLAGNLSSMQRDYDTLLAKHPDFTEKAKLAPGYAALGSERLASDQLGAALDAYRRALRLAPSAPEASQWRARLAYASAEFSLAEGVVDLLSYDQALALDPTLVAAQEARDRLSGAQSRRRQATKRNAATAALALLLGLAVVALRRRPESQPVLEAAE